MGSPARPHPTTEVLVLGDLNIDLALDVPEFPAPGGEGVATRQRIGFGGSASNTAVVLQRLGLRTALLSCVGDDEWGALAIAGIGAIGVDTSLVRRCPDEGTSLNIVAVTPDGERTMLAYRGASARLTPESAPADLGGVRHLHISGYALLADPQRSAAVAAARHARAAGVPVSLDVPVDAAGSAPATLLDFLSLVDVAVLGTDEARRLTGAGEDAAAARAVAEHGPGMVALKRGAGGALILAEGRLVEIPAPPVTAVDSTGAGDSFCAGLIAGLLRGADAGQAGLLATACGAAAVTVRGAGASLPGSREAAAVLAGLEPAVRQRLLALMPPVSLNRPA